MTSTMNRFLSVHSMSFVTCNMTHMTNWIVNGLPERFPKLKVIWIESGLAWVPFMMQRLDHEYLMRQSDAPLLKRLPSEYIADMYFTSQPMEVTMPHMMEATFKAIRAETQLMYSSTGHTGILTSLRASRNCHSSTSKPSEAFSARRPESCSASDIGCSSIQRKESCREFSYLCEG